MKSLELVPVALLTMALMSACAPRDIKPVAASDKPTQTANKSPGTGAGGNAGGSNSGGEQTSNSQDPNGFPVKLGLEVYSKAKNLEDFVEYFTSVGTEPTATRHLIGDKLPMKNEKQNTFGFYRISLRLMDNLSYKLQLTIFDLGGQKVSYGSTEGSWKLEKGFIALDKGNKAGSLPPLKAKGLIGLDNNNQPELFLDFDSEIKTADGMFKIPLKDGWFVFRYTPGVVETGL
jgi:hypothetical protein